MSKFLLVSTCLVFLLSIPSVALAQHLHCGTPDITPEQRDIILRDIKTIDVSAARNNGLTCIPIRVFALQDDNGSNGISEEDLAKGLATTNTTYFPMGIEFYYSEISYHPNSDLNTFDEQSSDPNGGDTEAAVIAATGQVSNAVNMYVVQSITLSSGFQAAGYAYFPQNTNASNIIFMVNSVFTEGSGGTLDHEFGHYFSLPHTFNNTSNGNNHPNAENVPRTGTNANCNTSGDLICDTEADPGYTPATFDNANCNYTGTGTDINGVAYTPPTDNAMSYFPACIAQHFTAGQSTQVQQGLAVRLSHTAYDYSHTPTVVNVPTGMAAVINSAGTGVSLSWTDNASNEVGYFIERSATSATAGFEPMVKAATASGGTSYEDLTVASNTDYWYRVKPVNGDCDTYSSAVMISVPAIYCGTTITNACDEYIGRVIIGSINNATACSAGAYGDYTAMTTATVGGMSYSLTINQAVGGSEGGGYAGDDCKAWIDWDQNGDFTDAGEDIALTKSPSSFQWTATVIPPMTAANGNTRMRIRNAWQITPIPCGNQDYGETEDYTLVVSGAGLPVEWLSFVGKGDNKGILLEWQTALESNNEHFTLEKSANGRDFVAIAEVRASNNENGADYQELDKKPFEGQNYYRVKQTDFDGTFTYSEVISVQWRAGQFFTLAPNPTRDNLNISFTKDIGEYSRFEIRSVTGQLFKTIEIDNFSSELKIDLSDLPKGIYWLQMQGQGALISERFVKL